MILEPTNLVTLGQLFIVIGGFLAQMLKEKCISNVFGDTFLMLSRYIFYDHDASVGCNNNDASVPSAEKDVQACFTEAGHEPSLSQNRSGP